MNHATFAAALLDPNQPCPPGLRSAHGTDAAGRFAVYRNNVQSSLIKALADAYPVVAQLVGAEFFQAMARLYLQHSPPCSPLLNDYGAELASFIQGFAPAAGLPYLAAMARLERLRVQAYHAADQQPVAPAQLAAALADPERLGQLCLGLPPSLATLDSAHAVVTLWAAHQSEADWQGLDIDQAESALILRHDLHVHTFAVGLGCTCFIEHLRRQQPLAIAAMFALQAQADFDLSHCLALLIRHGAITHLHLTKEA